MYIDPNERMIPPYEKRRRNLIVFGESVARSKDKPYILQPRLYKPMEGDIVLLMMSHGIGDILMMTPTIRALCAAGVTIDVFAGSYSCLFENNPFVRNNIPVNEIKNHDISAYAEVIDMHGIVEQSHLRHRVDEYADLVDLDVDSRELDYFVTTEEVTWADAQLPDGKNLVAYVWGSSTETRSLSILSNLSNLDALIEAGYTPVVFWHNTVDCLPSGCIDATGKYSIREAAALMTWCKCAITPDTGFFHLASALRIPIVTYFNVFPLENYQTFSVVKNVAEGDCAYQSCFRFNCPFFGEHLENPCISVKPENIIKAVKEFS